MKKLQITVSKKNGLKHQSGFTLVEVLVGITILSIGLLGVAKMQISAIRGNYMSSSTSTALNLAQQKMEDLMTLSYTDSDLDDSNTGNNAPAANLMPITSITDPDIDHSDTVTINNQGTFKRIWNIADHADPGGGTGLPTMKSITVIVTWENDKHQVRLFCLRR